MKVDEGDEDLVILRENGGPAMPVAGAADAMSILRSEAYNALNAVHSSG
jgi:hypothetical protein